MTDWALWADQTPAVPRRLRTLLEGELGPLSAPPPPVAVSEAVVRRSALDGETVGALRRAVAPGELHDDDERRARHAGGHAYADLIRRRSGDTAEAPDAVAVPIDDAGVRRVLATCAEVGVAVVPWGGGTSVVGGLSPLTGGHRGVVALDLSHFTGLVDVDETSLLATFRAGTRTPDAEAALGARGLTIGHFPQSFERASLGGYVVTRSAGQASTGYGRFDDLVVGLRMQTPIGELDLAPVAGSAAGPDLRRLVMGSEGAFGVVTEVTVRVRPLPAERRYEAWMLPSWAAGLDAFRAIAQHGPRPDIARLSDLDETRVSLAMSSAGALTRRGLSSYLRARGVADGCLVILGFEGAADDVRARRRGVRRLVRSAGGVSLGQRPGEAWRHGRYAGPRLRDALLGAGVLAETLETAATWTALPGLYAAVGAALRSALPEAVVGCHVSHVYPTGASLYFTVLAAAEPGSEMQQWSNAKRAVNDAIVRAGGTVTHHHAVGTAHRDHLAAEVGDVGLVMLRAVRAAVDPAGILNPEKLLPPG
jgi:alkyldihydroxyacetonephosphate synthase